jgi:hypothetical protein
MSAAGSLTVTVQKNPFMDGSVGGNFSIILDWTATSGGAVSQAIASTYSAAQALLNPVCPQPAKILGVLRSIEMIPGANGDLSTNAPSGSYTATFLDKYGFDVAAAGITGTSASAATKYVVANKVIVDSELTLTIGSAGNGKQGRIIMEFDEVGGHKF